MPKLFLIPAISLFDVHDVAVRDWLNKLDATAIQTHLEYPFSLDRFFSESSRHALLNVEEIHNEILRLLDIINPRAVFLDISVDFVELENKYNKRELSPLEFWSEYNQVSANMSGMPQSLYCIYINGIIDKEIRMVESKEHLPLSVVFYGLDVKTRGELIPVYENIFDKDSDFILDIARIVNELTNLREKPRHLWYTPMQVRHMAVSYEETEKFYTELLFRLERMLKHKVRDYIVKKLRNRALELVTSYEKFLDYKIREDEIKFSNIIEGLNVLSTQSGYSSIVIFCGPMHYSALENALKNEKRLHGLGISFESTDLAALLDKMKPFMQKNRIMQKDYEIALDILGRRKPARFENPGSILVPA